jgi:hypothetical protein
VRSHFQFRLGVTNIQPEAAKELQQERRASPASAGYE